MPLVLSRTLIMPKHCCHWPWAFGRSQNAQQTQHTHQKQLGCIYQTPCPFAAKVHNLRNKRHVTPTRNKLVADLLNCSQLDM